MKRFATFFFSVLLGASVLSLVSCNEPDTSMSEIFADPSIADLQPQETRFEEFSLFYDANYKGYLIGDYKGDATEVALPSFAIGEDGIEAPVIGLADYAFYGRTSITAVVLNESIAFIGKYAFGDSGVTDLRVTTSLTNIDEEAFADSSVTFYELDGIPYLPSMTSKYFLAYCGSEQRNLSSIHPACETVVFHGNGSVFLLNAPKNAKNIKCVIVPQTREILYDGYLGFAASDFYFQGMTMSKWISQRKNQELQLMGRVHLLDNYGKELTTVASSDFGDFTAVPEKCFYNCAFLTSVVLSKTIETIGEEAFYGCLSLTSLTVDPESTNFFSPEGSNVILYTYKGNTYLELGCAGSIIPNTVTIKGISGYAFAGSGLTSITIPSSVTEIGTQAFYNCPYLESLSVPSSITGVGYWAFSGMNSKAYYEENGVRYVGNENTPALILVAPKKDATITNLQVPKGCRMVLGYSFKGREDIESISLPSSVIVIGYQAFMDAKNLKSVEFPYNCKRICEEAFRGCSSLVDVTLPYYLEQVDDYAFSYCDSLKTVLFQERIQYVERNVFYKCPKLQHVYCKATRKPSGWLWEPSRVWFGYKG